MYIDAITIQIQKEKGEAKISPGIESRNKEKII